MIILLLWLYLEKQFNFDKTVLSHNMINTQWKSAKAVKFQKRKERDHKLQTVSC